MRLTRLVLGIVVLVVVVGGALYYKGMLTFGPNGPRLDTSQLSAPEVDSYTKGDAEFVRSHYAQALEAYQTAIRNNPDNPSRLQSEYRIAKCLEELDQPAAAVDAYKAFIEHYPNDKMVTICRGRIEVLTPTIRH